MSDRSKERGKVRAERRRARKARPDAPVHCSAHRKKDGQPCMSPPIHGLTVCRMHGGSTKSAKAKAQRVVAQSLIEADARALLAATGIEGVADPLSELGRVVAQAVALTTAAGSRVNSLDELRFEAANGTEQLRSEVVLFERGLDRVMRGLDLLIRHQKDNSSSEATSLLAALANQLGIDDSPKP